MVRAIEDLAKVGMCEGVGFFLDVDEFLFFNWTKGFWLGPTDNGSFDYLSVSWDVLSWDFLIATVSIGVLFHFVDFPLGNDEVVWGFFD